MLCYVKLCFVQIYCGVSLLAPLISLRQSPWEYMLYGYSKEEPVGLALIPGYLMKELYLERLDSIC